MIRALLVALALAVVGLIWLRGSAHSAGARADRAETQLAATQHALSASQALIETERVNAQRMAEIAEQYEQDKRHAQQTAESIAADLAAGNLRLRDEWRGCETDRAIAVAAGTAVADAATELRERLAAEIVSIGARADAQVIGLQAVIRADRGE